MIPHQTTPMTKFIRTTEGWLVIAADVGLIVVPIVTSVSPAKSLVLGVILNGATVGFRTTLKVVAALSPVFGQPIQPAGFTTSQMTPTPVPPSEQKPEMIEKITPDDLEQGPTEGEVEADTAVDPGMLAELGTPADQIRAAGAPDELHIEQGGTLA